MKKILILILALSIFASLGVNAYAEEKIPRKANFSPEQFEERINALIEKINEKQEASLVKKEEKSSEHLKAILEKNQKFLERVNNYSPDLYKNFSASYEDHMNVHEQIFQTRISIKKDFNDETIKGIVKLKEDLKVKIENKEIRPSEAMQEIRNYIAGRRQLKKERKEEFKSKVEEIKPNNKEEIKSLRKKLLTATADNDTEQINLIFNKLFEFFLEHLEFDKAKIQLME